MVNTVVNNGKILVVDDDTTQLLLIKKLLANRYELHVAKSGDEALNIIKNGFSPQVILSDQRMPGMSGTEFLEASIDYLPDAIRVLITAYSEPKEIIESINQAKCFMFLQKPVDNLTLLQSIKHCFNEFASKLKNKRLAVELKTQLLKLERYNSDSNIIFSETLPTLLNLTTVYERGYFTSHTQAVVAIGLELAKTMKLGIIRKSSIYISSILLNLVYQDMPDKFHFVDPGLLEDAERKEFFKIYNSKIDKYSSVKSLNKESLILSQIWEHFDGSGGPVGLSSNRISIESQIIQIAKSYHNMVYSIPNFDSIDPDLVAEYIQTPEISSQRHSEAVQSFFKYQAWFNLDLTANFQDLLKNKRCSYLVPEKMLIKLKFNGDEVRLNKYSVEDYTYDKNKKIVIPVERLIEEEKKKQAKVKELKAYETELPVSDIKSGMIAITDIKTKFGRIVVERNAKLTIDHIDEIRRLEKDNLMGGTFKVQIPRSI